MSDLMIPLLKPQDGSHLMQIKSEILTMAHEARRDLSPLCLPTFLPSHVRGDQNHLPAFTDPTLVTNT